MKVCASRPSSFVSERNKPHNGPAFLSALEYLNPAARHGPRQGFHLLINVAYRLDPSHCPTDGGEEEFTDKVTSSDVDMIGVTAQFALVADLRMPRHDPS